MPAGPNNEQTINWAENHSLRRYAMCAVGVIGVAAVAVIVYKRYIRNA